MRADFSKQDGVVVVELKGRLDFESTEPFRRTCIEKLLSEKVVFDLQHLSFVGSLGLKEFVDILDTMARKSGAGVKFCRVSTEFRRMFDASGLQGREIYDSPEKAILSFIPVRLTL